MERKELVRNIFDIVFHKGTYQYSWVYYTENGIKAIDLMKCVECGIDGFKLTTIALYCSKGRLVIGLHGYGVDDEDNEDCITYHVCEDESDKYCDKLSMDVLEKVYDIVNGIDMKSESWNYNCLMSKESGKIIF